LKPRLVIATFAAATAVLVLVGLVFLYMRTPATPGSTLRPAAMAEFVGSEICAGCHRAEAELWRDSHHALAMDHATDRSVLGDFNDTGFDYYGVRSRFFRRDGKFYSETDGPDGQLATFEVKFTFGVYPLQQYLIAFPDGRLQALSIAWDSRPKEQGGQRWFHLYPDEDIKHDDVLHWTKLNQNWNFMCAECHSTGVRKNYDASRDRFATTTAEIDVGCEACHGQGSRHVAWARRRQGWFHFGGDDSTIGLLVRFDERDGVSWGHNSTSGQPERSVAPAILRKEVETCGLCHARRGEFSEDWVPGRWLSDTHAVATLAHGLYSADDLARPRATTFAAGVTCSDCHDPHSARLRVSGDGACLQCHMPEKYETAAHSHHQGAEPPLACASCHMPVRAYMVVDLRHDHSFRVPRPDLSALLGTPNACNDCHRDKSAQWAAAAVEGWFGAKREGFQHFARAFDAAWKDHADTAQLLAVVAADPDTPGFVRASALTELGSRLSPSDLELARRSLADPDPMVRIGALDMMENIRGAQVSALVAPLLADPVRGVRIKAASLLASVPEASLPAADREHFERAVAEFVAAQRLNADRPESRSMLGGFDARRGRLVDAEAEFKAALKLSPQYSPAAINLADLYRAEGRESEGEAVLRGALAGSPTDAALHYALGLSLVRLKRPAEALDELDRAAALAPDEARYAYVYAVALNSAGRRDDAIAALKVNLEKHPADQETLMALVAFNRDADDFDAALQYAERLEKIEPSDPDLARLIEDLRKRAIKPAR
jgi:Flp pilus assembly protein TadD